MNTFECIKKRMSVRSFLCKDVEDDKLLQIAYMGLEAPTAMNSRDIVLTILQGNALDKIVDAMQIVLGEESKRFMNNGKFDFHRGGNALIVVSLGKNSVMPEQNTGCIMENMYLAAIELGLGACWINQFYKCKDENVRKTLKLKEGYEPYAALSVGYIDQKPDKRVRNGQIVFLD